MKILLLAVAHSTRDFQFVCVDLWSSRGGVKHSWAKHVNVRCVYVCICVWPIRKAVCSKVPAQLVIRVTVLGWLGLLGLLGLLRLLGLLGLLGYALHVSDYKGLECETERRSKEEEEEKEEKRGGREGEWWRREEEEESCSGWSVEKEHNGEINLR